MSETRIINMLELDKKLDDLKLVAWLLRKTLKGKVTTSDSFSHNDQQIALSHVTERIPYNKNYWAIFGKERETNLYIKKPILAWANPNQDYLSCSDPISYIQVKKKFNLLKLTKEEHQFLFDLLKKQKQKYAFFPKNREIRFNARKKMKGKTEEYIIVCSFEQDAILMPASHQVNKNSRLRLRVLGEKIGKGSEGVIYRSPYKLTSESPSPKESNLQIKFSASPSHLEKEYRNTSLVVDRCKFARFKNGAALSMPHIGGKDLFDILEEELSSTLETDLMRCLELAHETARIHLCSNIVHGDLKLENIVLDEKTGSLKIIDLGSSHSTSQTKFPTFFGCPDYSPPETQQNFESTEKRDVFALHILFKEICGLDPQNEKIPYSSRLPKWLDTLIKQMSEKNPKKRPDAWNIYATIKQNIFIATIDKKIIKKSLKIEYMLILFSFKNLVDKESYSAFREYICHLDIQHWNANETALLAPLFKSSAKMGWTLKNELIATLDKLQTVIHNVKLETLSPQDKEHILTLCQTTKITIPDIQNLIKKLDKRTKLLAEKKPSKIKSLFDSAEIVTPTKLDIQQLDIPTQCVKRY